MSQPNPDFWTDFIRSMSNPNPNSPFGAGIDHRGGPPSGPFGFGFPFGPMFPGGPLPHHGGPPGPHSGPGGHHRHPHHGRHRGGRHHQHHPDNDTRADEVMPDANNDAASATLRGDNDNENHPDPPEEAPGQAPPPDYSAHGGQPFPPWGGFFGMRGGCGRGRGRRGGPHRWGGRHADQQGWQTYLNEAMRSFQEGLAPNTNADEDTFSPPVDVFSTGSGWVLHVALPGAKKEDVRVSWDADKGVLTIGGLVYRPGSEEFLAGMVSGERRVGMFEREVKLPPRDAEGVTGEKEKQSKDEIDADGITAKMEDGILVVNVPVVEKEWTEIRKVDIM